MTAWRMGSSGFRRGFFYTVVVAAIALSMVERVDAQIYVDQQTRHRFAQLNVGFDLQAGLSGETRYLDASGVQRPLSLNTLVTPRLLIGGTHFWGHADFYVAVPVAKPKFTQSGQEVSYSSGIETVFKYYPWRIANNRLRPYVGLSLATFQYTQEGTSSGEPGAPTLYHTGVPLLAGLTFNARNHLVEVGALWNYANGQSYYLSRTDVAGIQTPPVYLSLSYRYMLETTLSAEADWESGRTDKVTSVLAQRGQLDGFYFGIGISSAFWLGRSSYNKANRPYIGNYGVSILPDIAAGYHFHKPDLNVAASYRAYKESTLVYGISQDAGRRSIGIEATKFLFDYHGFAPFLGPAITCEWLTFLEFEGQQILYDLAETKPGFGIVFGWDIRPNRIQSWFLRTNLRWFPDLKLAVSGDESMSFDNIEFNFIQLVIFPGRFF